MPMVVLAKLPLKAGHEFNAESLDRNRCRSQKARMKCMSPTRQILHSSLAGASGSKHTEQAVNGAPSKVLNLAEAAALMRCSRAHLSNVINGKIRGIPRLPAVRIGRRVLFRRESLEVWLQQVESSDYSRTSR